MQTTFLKKKAMAAKDKQGCVMLKENSRWIMTSSDLVATGGFKKGNQKKPRLTDQEGFNPVSNTGKFTFRILF